MNIDEQIAQRQQENAVADKAGQFAAAAALPGPTFDAFAQLPSVKVGPYEIREFCDADFETLQILKSPLSNMLAVAYQSGDQPEKQTEADEAEILKETMRGNNAWNVCFVMTEPVETIDDILREGGREALERKAKAKFGKLRTPAIMLVVKAAIDQMTHSWDTRLAYETAKTGAGGEEGAAEASRPPQ